MSREMSQTNIVTLACEHRRISGFSLGQRKLAIRKINAEKEDIFYKLSNKKPGNQVARFVDSEF